MSRPSTPFQSNSTPPIFRLALLSDIHGNPLALDAVLTDIEAVGSVDSVWFLGDFVALGYDPITVLQRIAQLSNARLVRGNTDRYLLTGERPFPTDDQVYRDPSLLPKLREVTSSFAWTHGALATTGWLSWLEQLPLEQRQILPGGTRLLGVHAAPGTDDGPGIHPGLTDAELRDAIEGSEADLICVGHTHVPLDRSIDGVRVVNVGSISNPVMADLRATYTLVEASATGYHLELRRVPYNHQAVIAALEAVGHPARNYLSRYMRGELRSRWTRIV